MEEIYTEKEILGDALTLKRTQLHYIILVQMNVYTKI